MAGHQKEKAIVDEVHQNQILRELYLKELRTQKLYTQYHVNPLRKGEGRYRTEEGKEGAPREGAGRGAEQGVRGGAQEETPPLTSPLVSTFQNYDFGVGEGVSFPIPSNRCVKMHPHPD